MKQTNKHNHGSFAYTSAGTIEKDGKRVGKSTANETVFETAPAAVGGSSIELGTDRGSIFID